MFSDVISKHLCFFAQVYFCRYKWADVVQLLTDALKAEHCDHKSNDEEDDPCDDIQQGTSRIVIIYFIVYAVIAYQCM